MFGFRSNKNSDIDVRKSEVRILLLFGRLSMFSVVAHYLLRHSGLKLLTKKTIKLPKTYL